MAYTAQPSWIPYESWITQQSVGSNLGTTTQTMPQAAVQQTSPLYSQTVAPVVNSQPVTTTTPPPSNTSGNSLDAQWAALHPGEGVRPVGWNGESGQSDPFAQQRSEIESGYNSYFASLDSMMSSDLPAQRASQEGIVNSQYQSGLADLTGQKEMGTADLATEGRKLEIQKTQSLKDIGSNIRNLMQAGNVYLGARGAGDSSAAGMYSYALTREANKQRGNVMGQYSELQSQIKDRQFKLDTIFNTEKNKLAAFKDEKLYSIATWFAETQRNLKILYSQGQLGRAKDLQNMSQQALNFATVQFQNTQAQYQNMQNTLMSWATARAQDMNQLKGYMNEISGFKPNIQTYSPMSLNQLFTGQTTGRAPVGYSTQELYDKNGNRVY